MITSDYIADKLASNDVKTYFAKPEKEDVIFEDGLDDLDKFISLMSHLKVNVAFIYRNNLEVEEIEQNMITNEDYSEKYEAIYKKDIKEFNKQLLNLKQHIGKEIFINTFFVHEGVVYSLLIFNNELMIEDKADFLDVLEEKYENQIDFIDTNHTKQRKDIKDEYFEKLKKYLIYDEQFKRCTNKALRKSYAFVLMRGGEDRSNEELKYPFDFFPTDREITPYIEEAWMQMKMNMK